MAHTDLHIADPEGRRCAAPGLGVGSAEWKDADYAGGGDAEVRAGRRRVGFPDPELEFDKGTTGAGRA